MPKFSRNFILIAVSLFALFTVSSMSCTELPVASIQSNDSLSVFIPDTSEIPNDKYGEMVRYGRALMLQTAYYIGPQGIKGRYLGNRMNCTQCHQDAGTKPFSLNLVRSHEQYPQYRAREAKVLSLAERVNNCVMRPHSGKPLPLDSKEMIGFLSWLKWINAEAPKGTKFLGEKNLSLELPASAAEPVKGEALYKLHCQRCHGTDGAGQMNVDGISYLYPPLWGSSGYQPGSSMHRVIKQAQWLKANMPHDLAKWNKPVLTDEECFHIAAFVNDDRIHPRPHPANMDYPYAVEKAIDYGVGPFIDTFSENSHKFGPYPPIIAWWKSNGLKPVY